MMVALPWSARKSPYRWLLDILLYPDPSSQAGAEADRSSDSPQAAADTLLASCGF